tara:strand:- start:14 stop:862 length:849 start_codon:yes stop_codon:yes gene_type:complete
MTSRSGIDWEDAFANGAYIADADRFPGDWAALSTQFRQDHIKAKMDLTYGDAPRETLDLFLPDAAPKGVLVFVHGGFWKAFDKSYWSHLAKGAVQSGYAVALPSYTLAPEATLPDMVRQIGNAIGCAADVVSGPIILAGHSAGGHLVTRMICEGTPLSQALLDRVLTVMSISGLHDLRPLLLNSMNDVLGLTKETATAESCALRTPVGKAKVIAWVGALERPEFMRQSSLLVESWGISGAQATLVVQSGYHHFNVIAGLQNPESPITQALLRNETHEHHPFR